MLRTRFVVTSGRFLLPTARTRPSVSHSVRHSSRRLKAKEQPPKRLYCTSSEGEATGSSKFSQSVTEGGKETRRNLKWSKATVIENKAASVDGIIRILVLSIEDHVEFMDGRKLKLIQDEPRWTDDFCVPGQFLGARGIDNDSITPKDGAERLLAIASSPNKAREDSALLDAAIVEVMVDRSEDPEERGLSYFGPGDVFEVTQPLGRGFVSLFSSNIGLLSALEEKRGLLMVSYGSTGLALMRSALNWSPVMALSTTQQVSFILITPSMITAPCVPEWDQWRENGVQVLPLYETPNGTNSTPETESPLETRVNEALFARADTFANWMKYPMEGAALMAGLPSSLSTSLTKKLMEHGVSRERFLFCEYF